MTTKPIKHSSAPLPVYRGYHSWDFDKRPTISTRNSPSRHALIVSSTWLLQLSVSNRPLYDGYWTARSSRPTRHVLVVCCPPRHSPPSLSRPVYCPCRRTINTLLVVVVTVPVYFNIYIYIRRRCRYRRRRTTYDYRNNKISH